VSLKDGDGNAVVRVADRGHVPGLGRTRLARELFSGRFRPGQCLQLDRIAIELSSFTVPLRHICSHRSSTRNISPPRACSDT
jgi:hypothetical protein